MLKAILYSVISLFIIPSNMALADLVRINASGSNANTETVSSISFDLVDDGNSTVVNQTAPAFGGSVIAADQANLRSINIGAGRLTNFGNASAQIRRARFPRRDNIEVLTGGNAVSIRQPFQFVDALAGTHRSGDLLNYLRIDDRLFRTAWDVVFDSAVDANNYLVVQERGGNSEFTIEALDSDGNIIADANRLSLGNGSFQWDLGISNSADPFNDQSQFLSVLDLDLFDTDEDIFGFRIFNSSNADLRLFTASIAVPEPTSHALLFGIGIVTLLRRRRKN